MTLVEILAEAMAGPDDWARFSPRARAEYRRMVRRALRVMAEHVGDYSVKGAVSAALAQDDTDG